MSPIYTFECGSCGLQLEELVPISELDDLKKEMSECKCTCEHVGMQLIIVAPKIDETNTKVGHNRKMGKRFKKRNKRIADMPKKQQKDFLKFANRHNVRKTW